MLYAPIEGEPRSPTILVSAAHCNYVCKVPRTSILKWVLNINTLHYYYTYYLHSETLEPNAVYGEMFLVRLSPKFYECKAC